MKVEDILERIQEVRPNEAIKLKAIFEQQSKEIGLLQHRLGYIKDYVYKNLGGSYTVNPWLFLIESHELQSKEVESLKEDCKTAKFTADKGTKTITNLEIEVRKKDQLLKEMADVLEYSHEPFTSSHVQCTINNRIIQTLSKYRETLKS